jgi:hypothetical protein
LDSINAAALAGTTVCAALLSASAFAKSDAFSASARRYNAWIAVPKGNPRNCVVSDVSETGARLAVSNNASVPTISC